MLAQLCNLVWEHLWTLVIDAVLTVLLLYPLITFVRFGWWRRADEICGSLNADAKKRYLAIFHKKNHSREMADRAFWDFYVAQYGLKHFVIPLVLLLVIAAVGNFFLAQSLQDLFKPGAVPTTFRPAGAAIAGAYTFVCWDLFSRMQRLTLSRADILRASLRLLVAVPIGFAFATLLKEDVAPFIAFGMGAFPIQIIGVILQRQMKTRLNLEWGSQAARDQVFLLSGIDTLIAERIEDADVTTITQLAWEDPVQLTMRTNLQFAFVIDIISQALAWVYLEEKLKPMGVVGLHGAVEIRSLGQDLGIIRKTDVQGRPVVIATHEVVEDDDGIRVTDQVIEYEAVGGEEAGPGRGHKGKSKLRITAEATLKAAAKIADVDQEALKYAILEIGEDPTAEFLEICWDSLTSGH